MDDGVRVLHVDDELDFADVTATFLEREYDKFAVETATSASEGLERLDDGIDCVVSDYYMAGQNGIEFLEAVREEHPDLPFVLFTGKGSETVASDAISAGVTEYIEKGDGTEQYAILANRIRTVVERYRTEREAARTRTQLEAIAEHSADAIVTIDSDSRICFANAAIEDHFGYTPEDLRGERLTTIIPERHRESHLAAIDRYVETGERTVDWSSVELTGLRADGTEIPLSISFGEYDRGGERRFVGVLRDITERAERTRQLETLISNLPGVVYQCHNRRSWPMEFVRGECESLTGYPAETIQAGDVTWGEDLIHPADRERVWTTVQDALEADEPFETTYRIRAADGTTRWVWERGQAVDAPAADGPMLEGFITDITDRKEHEQELKQTNTLLSTLIETLPVGVLVEDSSRNVMAINQQLLDLFDRPGTSEELLGEDCERLARDVSDQFVDSEGFADRIAEVIDAGEPVSGDEFERDDGRVFERGYRPLDLPDGDGHLWVYRDITERTEHERTLRAMTRRLEALNRATRDLLAAETREAVAETGVDVAADVLEVEPNAIHLYDDEDYSGLVPVAATDAVYDLVGDPPTFAPGTTAWHTYERGEPIAIDEVDAETVYGPEAPVQSELQIPIPGEGVLIAESRTSAAFDDQDVLLGELLAGNIATALEQVERTGELRARERELRRQNERLEEFASVVSHDLRNPLNIASGRLELALEECDSDHLDAIERAHDRMAALIADLLVLTREGGDGTDATRVDLATFARSCWQNVDTAAATLVTDVDRTILADEAQLKQLFENLVRNAVEHGDDDVTVTVGQLEDGFYVEDDGPGIPPAERDQVFEAGYSTLRDGTGFGLSIVRQVAEAHDWTVDVTDSAAGGARFEITGVEWAGE